MSKCFFITRTKKTKKAIAYNDGEYFDIVKNNNYVKTTKKITNNMFEFDKNELEYMTPNAITLFYNLKCIITNIPYSIKTIQFHPFFNANIFPYIFQHLNIICLIFGRDFNQQINNLPPNLEIIQLGNKFNHPVSNLPFKLKIIKFGREFNQSIDCLPESIEYIQLSHYFNHPIENLPSNFVKEIKFGYRFNQSIDCLPDSITTIRFSLSSRFNKDIVKLPAKLQFLKIPWEYKCMILTTIPPNVKKLIIPSCYPKNKLNNIQCDKNIIEIKQFHNY